MGARLDPAACFHHVQLAPCYIHGSCAFRSLVHADILAAGLIILGAHQVTLVFNVPVMTTFSAVLSPRHHDAGRAVGDVAEHTHDVLVVDVLQSVVLE